MRARIILCLSMMVALTGQAHAAGVIAASPPPAIVLDLSRAALIADRIAACAAAERKPGGWTTLAQTSAAETEAARARAEAVFGRIDLIAAPPRTPTLRCSRWSRSDARLDITELTRSVDLGLAAVAHETSQGVWLGLFPLCADTVAEVTSAQLAANQYSITARLKPEAAALLQAYSARFIRPRNPPAMSLRVNGAEIAAPRVFEPIQNEVVLTWSGDPLSFDLTRQALLTACPAGLKLSPTPSPGR
jgi:hypothetical protein